MLGTFVIIDDHPLYRSGISALVHERLGLRCIGEASTLQEARALLAQVKPTLAIIDISLQDENGLTLVSECKQSQPSLKMLVVSMHDESLYGERALKAGSHGYVMKHEAPEVLIHSIRLILEGQLGISQNLKDRLVERFATGSDSHVDRLSERELEILGLIGKGYGALEIASSLSISVKTVHTHQDHIKQKLGLLSASELRRFAVHWYADKTRV